MPRYEAYTRREFEKLGLTTVALTRTGANGIINAGVFLVDLNCLGVKDAFLTELAVGEWPEQLDRMIAEEDRIALNPACARKLVEGAVAYAAALGFAPHPDYKKACRVFGGLTASDCDQDFTYGRDGKPLYVAGPDDTSQHINLVLRILTNKLGPDGFNYVVPERFDPEDEME